MKWLGFVVPMVLALVNVPFFPDRVNIVSASICFGIGIVGFINFVMDD